MNLIPVDGAGLLGTADPDNIVLGSAPPSPTPSERAQAPTSPPLPPLPPAEQSLDAAAIYAAPHGSVQHEQQQQQQQHPPHVASQPPRDAFASSLNQLSGEAAFLPRSAVERASINQLHAGQGANPSLSLRPQAAAMSRAASEEAEMYIPGLMSTTLFVMLPNADSLTPIIEKYFQSHHRPQRDLSGAWRGRNVEQLIASRSWRAVAEYCHDSIMAASPEQTSHLLSLWSLRLHALLRLHLIDHLTTELSALFALLPPSTYLAPNPPPSSPESPRFHPAVPFELHILFASLHGLRGDMDRTVEDLAAILRGSKEELWAATRRGDRAQADLWTRRAEAVGGLLTDTLTRIKSSSSVSSLLSSASSQPSLALFQALARLHVSTGDLSSLSQTTAALSGLPLSSDQGSRAVRKAKALEKVARGQWSEAEKECRLLVEGNPADAEAQNNLAVVLLFQCKVDEAIAVLRRVLTTSVGYSSETVLFNLATLLELRTEAALPLKLELLRGVIDRGGEGVKSTCLKLAV